MTSSAKRKFKRFENFYLKGELQAHFIKRLKHNYQEELDVFQSWFDYCEEKHGKIAQPQLENNQND